MFFLNLTHKRNHFKVKKNCLYGKILKLYPTKKDFQIQVYEYGENGLQESTKILKVNYKNIMLYQENNINSLFGKCKYWKTSY